MAELQLPDGASLFYRENDFSDPWKPSEAALLLHGFGENGLAWNGWVPTLGHRFRVIRPDMRGFGRSSAMPEDYPWSVDGIVADFVRLMDELEVERFHLFGAKVGGGIAMRFAALHPGRVKTLTVTGAFVLAGAHVGATADELYARVRREGIEGWARDTMARRLGPDCDPRMVEAWIEMMAATPRSTLLGFMAHIPGIDVRDDLPRIEAPTLIVMNEGGDGASVEQARARQKMIPHSELLVMPVQSSHVAATHAAECARAALDRIDRNAPGGSATERAGSWSGLAARSPSAARCRARLGRAVSGSLSDP